MSNPLEVVGHGLKVAAEDVVKGAEEVLSVGAKVIKVVEDAKALTPEFKSELAVLVDDAKALAGPLAPVLASGGKNPVADVVAVEPVLSDVIKLVKDFVSFLPTLEAALKKVAADVVSK